MKNLITTLAIVTVFTSCEKNPPSVTSSAEPATTQINVSEESLAPYGKNSNWICLGGDTAFTQTLTLDLYYIEKAHGCNLYHYEMSYPIWSDYEYSHSVSGCISQTDTLIIKDFNTDKTVKFLRVKK